ncbi:MAG: U32 family peptidase [Acidobacteriota bacterium]|nr:U32 family peptidase [Acidobacteriota bacterium]
MEVLFHHRGRTLESAVRRKPEIMSPAGYWPQLRAAIEAGADSVYFGLNRFSARAKVGFVPQELPEVMRTLHRRGVRGYLTFNTLVFEQEIEEAARLIGLIAQAGIDAMIVQDVGTARLAREIAPSLELHASTQMSITDAAGVRFAQELGLSRVTLARELSLQDLRSIAAETDCDLEIFVHGALCVAYSGQCFSSEAWGGRSANRGQCAQACRLPYDLLVDGEERPLGDARYLLSPGDLFALEQVPEIIDIGIAALKIEGRYKDAEYVALTTRAYREAVDAAWTGAARPVTAAGRLQLEQVYSRGLGPFFLQGVNHQIVVEGRAPRHRGVFLGTVAHAGPAAVVVHPSEAQRIAPVKPGDGIVFDAADWRSPQEDEEGGRVFEVFPTGANTLELRFANGALRHERIRAGDRVWRTGDPAIERAARPYTHAESPVARQPVRVHVVAREGEPLLTEWHVGKVLITANSTGLLGRAITRGLTEEMLREQLGRLGGTAYRLEELTAETDGMLFAAASVLNAVRRDAVAALIQKQERGAAHAISPFVPRSLPEPRVTGDPDRDYHLHLLVRNQAQLEAALTLNPASVTLDYLDLYGLRPSVVRIKASGIAARIATPRVLKPGETKILQFLLSLDCGILVRAAGMLDALRGAGELTGDFSLNTANTLTARAYLDRGLSRLTPTHDLNAAQVAELACGIGPQRIEAILYQHLPVFHTEHCVFCRFLSSGTSYRDCGRPCEKHQITLRDERGRQHPVIADVGCRNTVFGAEAQQPGEHLEGWREAGIRHYRLEFVHETPDQIRRISRICEQALRGKGQLARDLRAVAPAGVTEGSLQVPFQILQ